MTEIVVERTEKWLKDWVIALNLCPFAQHPFEQGLVHITATDSMDLEEIYQFVLKKLDDFYQTPPGKQETLLVVIEKALKEFDDYLEFLSLVEQVIDDVGLTGVIQVASFHPDYCFDGIDRQDATHYTNRSPYPIFHFIREESLEKVLSQYRNPESIPKRNMTLLRKMGMDSIQRKLSKI